MGVFENLPYANFHELNLDWIIKALKESIETLHDGVEYIQQVEQEIQDLDLSNAVSELNRQKAQLQKLVNTPVFVNDDVNFETLSAYPEIPTTSGGVRVGKISGLVKGLWIFQAVLTVKLEEGATVVDRSQLLSILTLRASGSDTNKVSSRNTVPVSGGGAYCSNCVTLIANVADNDEIYLFGQRNQVNSAADEALLPAMVPTHMHLRGFRLCSDQLAAANS